MVDILVIGVRREGGERRRQRETERKRSLLYSRKIELAARMGWVLMQTQPSHKKPKGPC